MDSVNFNSVSQQLDAIFASETDSIGSLDCGDGISLSRIPNRILSKYLHNKWKSDSTSDIYSNAYKFYTKNTSFTKRMSAFIRSMFKKEKDLDKILQSEVQIENKSADIKRFLDEKFDSTVVVPEKSLRNMSGFSNKVKNAPDPIWLSALKKPLVQNDIVKEEDLDKFKNTYNFAHEMNVFLKDLAKANPQKKEIVDISNRLDKQLKSIPSLVMHIISIGGDINKIDKSSIDTELFPIVFDYYNAFVENNHD